MRTVIALSLVFVSSVFVTASNDWRSQPFSTWTPEQARSILVDSPWAGDAHVRYTVSRGGNGQAPITIKSRATWNSALPVRQAEWLTTVAQSAVPGAPAPQDQSPSILITVTLTGNDAQPLEFLIDRAGKAFRPAVLQQGKLRLSASGSRATMLDPAGVPMWQTGPPFARPMCKQGTPTSNDSPVRPVWPNPYSTQTGPDSPTMPAPDFGLPEPRQPRCYVGAVFEFEFPRAAGIRIENGDIEFKSELGTSGYPLYTVTRTFKPKTMVVAGQLAL